MIAAPLDHILHSDTEIQTGEVDQLLEKVIVIILSGFGWVLTKDGEMDRQALAVFSFFSVHCFSHTSGVPMKLIFVMPA